jgi:hypothetical protein
VDAVDPPDCIGVLFPVVECFCVVPADDEVSPDGVAVDGTVVFLEVVTSLDDVTADVVSFPEVEAVDCPPADVILPTVLPVVLPLTAVVPVVICELPASSAHPYTRTPTLISSLRKAMSLVNVIVTNCNSSGVGNV